MNVVRLVAAAAGLLLPAWPAAADDTPRIRFLHPVDGQSVSGPVRLALEASSPHAIGEVSVLKEGAVLGIDLAAPFELLWDTTREPDGPYILVAKTRDAEFREASTRITITVDNTPPGVSWAAPGAGSVAVGVIRLEARAEDILGLRAVKFLANGEAIGEAAAPPYAIDWDTGKVPNTRYALQARAVDLAGNTVLTEPVSVRVANFNRYPVLEPVGSKTLPEGAELRFTVAGADPDAPRDPLHYAVTGLPDWARFDPKTLTIAGVPGPLEAGLERPAKVYGPVTIEVCDPEPLCDREEISITVTDSNQAPVVKNPGNKYVPEGETLTFTVTAADPDNDPLKCHAKLLPKWGVFNSKTCTFTGVPGFNVASLSEQTVSFKPVKFEFCDDAPLCTTEEIAIDVLNVNSGPKWNRIDLPPAEEGRPWTADITAWDPDEDSLTIKSLWLPDGADLADLGNGTGRIRWTPRADQSGTYEAKAEVSDRNLDAQTAYTITVKERIPALSGLVLDTEDNPLPGVNIKVFFQGKVEQIVATDKRGYYLITGLRERNYEIRPDYQLRVGFTTAATKLKTAVFSPTGFRLLMTKEDERGGDFRVSFQ